VDLDNDVRGAREQQFGRCLNALTLDVGEHVFAARRFEHVVHESNAATRVDVAQCPRLALEEQRDPWTLFSCHASTDRLEVVLNSRRDRFCLCASLQSLTERANRRGDID